MEQEKMQNIIQANQMPCNELTTRVKLDLDDHLILQCKVCLIAISPLNAVDYFMQIQGKQQSSSRFLVLRKYHYDKLQYSRQEKFLERSEPFDLMYIIPVKCAECHSQIGIYYETVNIKGNKWLLERISINLTRTTIIHDQRDLIQTLRHQIQSNVEKIDKMKKWSRFEIAKRQFQEQENSLSEQLLKAVDPTKHQNILKGMAVQSFLSRMTFLDNRMNQLQAKSKEVSDIQEQLKTKINFHGSVLQGMWRKTNKKNQDNKN